MIEKEKKSNKMLERMKESTKGKLTQAGINLE